MSAQVVPTIVLLAEDDPNDVWLITRLFAQTGSNVRLHVVNSGEEAIDYLRGEGRFADRAAYPFPAVVLLDIQLPGQSGLEVLRWIRAQPRTRGLIVIMLTGSESADHLHAAYELHVNSFLRKTPLLSMPDISKAVLNYWLQLNQVPAPPEDSRGPAAAPPAGLT